MQESYLFTESGNILSWKGPPRIIKSTSERNAPYRDRSHNLGALINQLVLGALFCKVFPLKWLSQRINVGFFLGKEQVLWCGIISSRKYLGWFLLLVASGARGLLQLLMAGIPTLLKDWKVCKPSKGGGREGGGKGDNHPCWVNVNLMGLNYCLKYLWKCNHWFNNRKLGAGKLPFL